MKECRNLGISWLGSIGKDFTKSWRNLSMNKQSNHKKRGGYGKHKSHQSKLRKRGVTLSKHSHNEAVVANPVTAIMTKATIIIPPPTLPLPPEHC
jgi:hypothetical protein